MRQRCVANLDNVHVVLKSALRERIGSLGANRHSEVKRALGYALDWAELKVVWAGEQRVRCVKESTVAQRMSTSSRRSSSS
jgi:hypothetical protein